MGHSGSTGRLGMCITLCSGNLKGRDGWQWTEWMWTAVHNVNTWPGCRSLCTLFGINWVGSTKDRKLLDTVVTARLSVKFCSKYSNNNTKKLEFQHLRRTFLTLILRIWAMFPYVSYYSGGKAGFVYITVTVPNGRKGEFFRLGCDGGLKTPSVKQWLN